MVKECGQTDGYIPTKDLQFLRQPAGLYEVYFTLEQTEKTVEICHGECLNEPTKELMVNFCIFNNCPSNLPETVHIKPGVEQTKLYPLSMSIFEYALWKKKEDTSKSHNTCPHCQK